LSLQLAAEHKSDSHLVNHYRAELLFFPSATLVAVAVSCGVILPSDTKQTEAHNLFISLIATISALLLHSPFANVHFAAFPSIFTQLHIIFNSLRCNKWSKFQNKLFLSLISDN
jgi:hypothetical protein